jgi:hypothetical protein
VPLDVTGEPETVRKLGAARATDVTVPIAVDVMVISPVTPFAFVSEIPVPATRVRVDQVSVPVLTAIPVVASPSTAARSFARAKAKVPLVVIGDPVIVRPADGCVAAIDVTVPLAPARIWTQLERVVAGSAANTNVWLTSVRTAMSPV